MSQLEDQLAQQITFTQLPVPLREYRFHPDRKWRSDFVWPEQKLIVEVEGGIYSHGRHTRGAGFENDCEKYNNAVLLGFDVLRVTSNQIKSGEALKWVAQLLKEKL